MWDFACLSLEISIQLFISHFCFLVIVCLFVSHGISTFVSYLMSNPFYTKKQFYFKQFKFSISTQFSSIWPIDGTLSGATTAGQNGPGSDGKEGLLCIPQSSSITEVSLSYCLGSYHDARSVGGGSYPSPEKQSVYSTAPTDWATSYWCSVHHCVVCSCCN